MSLLGSQLQDIFGAEIKTIYENDAYTLMRSLWTPHQRTPPYSVDSKGSCYIMVVAGYIREQRFAMEKYVDDSFLISFKKDYFYPAGRSITEIPHYPHILENVSDEPAETLHIYVHAFSLARYKPLDLFEQALEQAQKDYPYLI